jgi:hypothetical protein
VTTSTTRTREHLVQNGEPVVADHRLDIGQVAQEARILAEDLWVASAEKGGEVGDGLGQRVDEPLDLGDQRRYRKDEKC